jgi:glutamate-1-semialdehyde 2,1-aminomutase
VSSNVRSGPPSLPPLYFEAGKGSRLFDVDGNTYVDYTLGQGPTILGHAPGAVIDRVTAAIRQGQLYAGQHELEIRLSEKLQQLVPCAEMVRYSNSGSEIVQAALRLARAYTGREKIVKFEGHYHGWFDNVLISIHPPLDRVGPRERPYAVPASEGQTRSAMADVVVLPWNDLDILSQVVAQEGHEIAAIIMEPIMCNTGCILPQQGYLEGVRKLCSEHGIVLIFDEIITGFRVGLGGAQEYFGVTPDLATFGKAMAGGFPVSCLAGKRELMELIASGEVNHSGTFNSNVPAMAASLATLNELQKGDGEAHEHIYQLGNKLSTGLKESADQLGLEVQVQGPGPMFHFAFASEARVTDYRTYARICDTDTYHRLAGLLLDEGIRVIPRGLWYLSTAHTEDDVEFTLESVKSALRKLKRGGETNRGSGFEPLH